MKNIQNNRHATNFSAKLFSMAIIAIVMSQTIVVGQTITSDVFMSGAVLLKPTPQRMFTARNYGGKCLDFGAPPQVTGGPVYLYGCNGTIAQQLRIVEINDRHDVRLYLGNKVLGVKQPLVNNAGVLATTAAPINDLPLELQNEADLNTIFARTQIFTLDGDSIIWAANRDMVVKVQNARGINRTPLVAGKRNLSDEEFWDFAATDGSGTRPTTGFVRVPQAGDTRLPADQFIAAVRSAKRGTVIELGADFALTDLPSVVIPAGVTIRGNRRGTLLGPELLALNQAAQEEFSSGVPAGMLQIAGDEVRITGLRISGPNNDGNVEDHTMPRTGGIVAPDQYRSIIDHNDLSNWTVAAINVVGDEATSNANTQNARTRPQNTRIVRNFIHDNQYLYENNGSGYGIATGNGGYPFIEGNLFLRNIHSIAGDGSPRSGYRALSNLVLADDPLRGTPGFRKHSQDFDMHGTGGGDSRHHVGGQAGEYIEIAWNTFLATNRENFNLRGKPSDVAEFHHNVSLRQASAALVCSSCGDGLKAYDNQFGASNPTNRLGIGDFDGDGRDDLFLATGTGWYYAPAGNAEWRLLSTQTDKIDNLMFGDFDGDGRTDVFTQHGYNWDVSWGGRSNWEKINASGNILGNAAIGDFNGDHRADVFYTDGQHWYISYGGVSPFTLVNDSSFRVPNLRFGDFNGDGKTDVFGVGAKYWQVSYSATGGWAVLQPRLTDTATYLLVTDFNGDGRADVTTLSMVTMSKVSWKVSYSGMDGWKELRTLPLSVKVAALGRFDGNRSTDLLLWHDNYLDISANGTGAAQRQSRQDMR